MEQDNSHSDFTPLIIGELRNSVYQWYFPTDFCHSKFLGRQNESTACTLIVLLMAECIEENKTSFELMEKLNPKLVEALANCILDGNNLLTVEMEKLHNKKSKILFNVVDGLKHCNISSFKELKVFQQRLRKTFFDCLKEDFVEAIDVWDSLNEQHLVRSQRNWPNLYMVVIAFKYCFLVVYQPSINILALVDPHCHLNERGAVIAAAQADNMNEFYDWICDNIFPMHIRKTSSSYEMTLLFKKDLITEQHVWID